MALKYFVFEEDGVRSAINLKQVVYANVERVNGKPVLMVTSSDGQKRQLHGDFIGNFFTALGPLDAKRFGKPGT